MTIAVKFSFFQAADENNGLHAEDSLELAQMNSVYFANDGGNMPEGEEFLDYNLYPVGLGLSDQLRK